MVPEISELLHEEVLDEILLRQDVWILRRQEEGQVATSVASVHQENRCACESAYCCSRQPTLQRPEEVRWAMPEVRGLIAVHRGLLLPLHEALCFVEQDAMPVAHCEVPAAVPHG